MHLDPVAKILRRKDSLRMATTGNSEEMRALAIVITSDVGAVHIVSFLAGEGGTVSHDLVRRYFSSHMLERTHGRNRLVFDLTGVSALDSAALGPLVQKLREVQESNGKLLLTGVQAPALREIFALTRFDKVFPILPTRAEAIAAAAG